MWLMVMFDLPTDTKAARKVYRKSRGALLDDGFTMLQYSVYARHCPSFENSEVHEKRINAALPPDGEVRLLLFHGQAVLSDEDLLRKDSWGNGKGSRADHTFLTCLLEPFPNRFNDLERTYFS